MKRKWTTRIAALPLALSLGMQPAPPASAQIPVIDPSNLAQSIMQVTHMVEQIRNQVRQIEQATAMLRQNPLQLSPEISQSIGDARSLFESVQGIAFEANQLGQELRTLYLPSARSSELVRWATLGQDGVEDDDELSHDGGDNELGGFAAGLQPLGEGGEPWIAPTGDERGHIECSPQRVAARFDVTRR